MVKMMRWVKQLPKVAFRTGSARAPRAVYRALAEHTNAFASSGVHCLSNASRRPARARVLPKTKSTRGGSATRYSCGDGEFCHAIKKYFPCTRIRIRRERIVTHVLVAARQSGEAHFARLWPSARLRAAPSRSRSRRR